MIATGYTLRIPQHPITSVATGYNALRLKEDDMIVGDLGYAIGLDIDSRPYDAVTVRYRTMTAPLSYIVLSDNTGWYVDTVRRDSEEEVYDGILRRDVVRDYYAEFENDGVFLSDASVSWFEGGRRLALPQPFDVREWSYSLENALSSDNTRVVYFTGTQWFMIYASTAAGITRLKAGLANGGLFAADLHIDVTAILSAYLLADSLIDVSAFSTVVTESNGLTLRSTAVVSQPTHPWRTATFTLDQTMPLRVCDLAYNTLWESGYLHGYDTLKVSVSPNPSDLRYRVTISGASNPVIVEIPIAKVPIYENAYDAYAVARRDMDIAQARLNADFAYSNKLLGIGESMVSGGIGGAISGGGIGAVGGSIASGATTLATAAMSQQLQRTYDRASQRLTDRALARQSVGIPSTTDIAFMWETRYWLWQYAAAYDSDLNVIARLATSETVGTRQRGCGRGDLKTVYGSPTTEIVAEYETRLRIGYRMLDFVGSIESLAEDNLWTWIPSRGSWY